MCVDTKAKVLRGECHWSETCKFSGIYVFKKLWTGIFKTLIRSPRYSSYNSFV